MMQFQRQESSALRRPLAVLGATAVAVGALVPTAGTATAVSDVQDLAPACEGLMDSVGFEDIGWLAEPTQQAINCAYNYGITNGKVDGEVYAPVDAVKRYEMALFISRSIDVIEFGADIDVVDAGAAARSTFTDLGGVPSEAKAAIDRLAELGIVHGKDSSTYDPYGPVNRRDMARFINRVQTEIVAAAVPGAEYDPAARTKQFLDVADSMKGSLDIYAIQGAGIVQGHSTGRYEPFQSVRRDHMALYIMRHLADNVEAGNLFWLVDDEAPDGFSGDVSVEYVDKDFDIFGDLDTSFWYDDTDVFTVDGKGVTITQFEAALSSGDGITVTSYQQDPGLSSRFDLRNVNPAAPGVDAKIGGLGSENDITVTVTPADGYWDTVRLEKAAPGGDFQAVAVLTFDDAGANGAVTYYDADLVPGEYRYRAAVVNDGEVGPVSAVAAVVAAEPTDVTSPVAHHVTLERNFTNELLLDTGDIIRIAFNEPIEPLQGGETIRVSADGTIADIVNIIGNSSFQLSTAAEEFDGVSYGAGQILRIKVEAPQVHSTGPSGLSLPATITMAEIYDANGVKWDISKSSDLVIEPLN